MQRAGPAGHAAAPRARRVAPDTPPSMHTAARSACANAADSPSCRRQHESPWCGSSRVEGRAHDALRLLDDTFEVIGPAEALRVDLVDVFRAGRACGEPAARGNDLKAADRGIVSGRLRENLLDRLARELLGVHLLRGQLGEPLLLLGRRASLHAIEHRRTEGARKRPIDLAGITAGPSGDLRGEQGGRDAVLVRRPYPAITAQERCAGALLASEPERAFEQPIHEPFETHRDLV